MTSNEKVYKLEVIKTAIICPVCGRKIRGVRVPPGAVLRGVSIRCSGCRQTMIVTIDQASATQIARAINSGL